MSSDAASAAQVTFDQSTGGLCLASDSAFMSSTYGLASTFYFRMTKGGVSSAQSPNTCSVASGTGEVVCASSEGYTVLHTCSVYLSLGNTNSCATSVTVTFVLRLPLWRNRCHCICSRVQKRVYEEIKFVQESDVCTSFFVPVPRYTKAALRQGELQCVCAYVSVRQSFCKQHVSRDTILKEKSRLFSSITTGIMVIN